MIENLKKHVFVKVIFVLHLSFSDYLIKQFSFISFISFLFSFLVNYRKKKY